MLKTEPTYVDTERDGRKVKDIILPNPYLCIGKNRQDIYYQDGEFYSGKGEPPLNYDDVPEWFWNLLKTSYDSDTIKKWGIVLPENRVKTKEEKEQIRVEKAMELWKCTYSGCNKEIPIQQKGLHIATHRRKEYIAKRKVQKEQAETLNDKP
jgi:hypothetical protein